MKLSSFVYEELTKQDGIGPLERATYVVLDELLPSTKTRLASLVGVRLDTLSRACSTLESLGWLALAPGRGNSLRPIPMVPHASQEQMAKILELCYSLVGNKGEFLMKSFLDLRVKNRIYVDNARPDFLKNPKTGENLEYDRLYICKDAFEYDGDQHQRLTEKYPDESALRDLQARDAIKKGLSQDAAVRLITVGTDALMPDLLDALIPADIERRPLDTEGPLYNTLVRLCSIHIASARRKTR